MEKHENIPTNPDEHKQSSRFTRFVRHVGDGSTFTLPHAFSCARAGLAYAFRSQRNFKIHGAIALIALLLGLLLQVSEAAWFSIIICIFVVFSLELVNTAIESVVDFISPEWHELAKAAKDCAAGAVYLAAIGSVVVALVAYIPPILRLLGLQ